MHPTLWPRRPRAWLVGVLLAAGLAYPGLAQVYTPTRGTPERSAILDTVRLRVETDVVWIDWAERHAIGAELFP